MRPTPSPLRPRAALLALCGLVLGAVGCGHESPVWSPGTLAVTSEPAGAAIVIDGRDTGRTTPWEFGDQPVGAYEVSVALAGWLSAPAQVQVRPLDTTTEHFVLYRRGVAVFSEPAGARILVEGADSGRVTPDTLAGLAAGPVTLSLALDGYLTEGADLTVTVPDSGLAVVPAGAVALRSRRTVVLESFSNVDCQGCPDLTRDLVAVLEQPGFGPDRLLAVEFSVNWPGTQDPLFLDNAAENTDRYLTYAIMGAPSLFGDGVPVGTLLSPPDAADIAAAAVAGWAGDPGFLIDVAADFAGSSVPVTVTLTALRTVDLGGHSLLVILTQDPVQFPSPPGSNGEDTFRHVFRDRVDAPPGLDVLAAGQILSLPLTLSRSGDWDPAGLQIVAFVQDDASHAILQAGSSAAGIPAGSRFLPADGGPQR